MAPGGRTPPQKQPPPPDLAAHVYSIDGPQERWKSLDNSSAIELDTLSLTDKGEGLHGPAITDRDDESINKLDVYPISQARLLLRHAPTPFFAQQKPKRTLSSWALSGQDFVRWYCRLLADETTISHWRDAGIDRFLSLCAHPPLPDADLFKAAICFWCTESNSFVFPFGTMTITLLDVVALTGLSRHRSPTIARLPFNRDNPIPFDRSYRSLYNTNSPTDPAAPITDGERAYFIHYWLNKFILCPGGGQPVQAINSTYQIAAGECENLAEVVLCHLYRGMYLTVQQIKKATEAKQVTGAGPLWLLQLWLYAYFPAVRGSLPAPADMAHDTAILSYGHYYAKAPPLKKDFATYFPVFYEAGDVECFTPFEARLFGPPSFRLAFNQKPPEGDASLGDYNWYVEEWARWIVARDMLFAPEASTDLSIEVYNPHFASRQFGLAQQWPIPLAFSKNYPRLHSRLADLSEKDIADVKACCDFLLPNAFKHFIATNGVVTPLFQLAWNSKEVRYFNDLAANVISQITQCERGAADNNDDDEEFIVSPSQDSAKRRAPSGKSPGGVRPTKQIRSSITVEDPGTDESGEETRSTSDSMSIESEIDPDDDAAILHNSTPVAQASQPVADSMSNTGSAPPLMTEPESAAVPSVPTSSLLVTSASPAPTLSARENDTLLALTLPPLKPASFGVTMQPSTPSSLASSVLPAFAPLAVRSSPFSNLTRSVPSTMDVASPTSAPTGVPDLDTAVRFFTSLAKNRTPPSTEIRLAPRTQAIKNAIGRIIPFLSLTLEEAVDPPQRNELESAFTVLSGLGPSEILPGLGLEETAAAKRAQQLAQNYMKCAHDALELEKHSAERGTTLQSIRERLAANTARFNDLSSQYEARSQQCVTREQEIQADESKIAAMKAELEKLEKDVQAKKNELAEDVSHRTAIQASITALATETQTLAARETALVDDKFEIREAQAVQLRQAARTGLDTLRAELAYIAKHLTD